MKEALFASSSKSTKRKIKELIDGGKHKASNKRLERDLYGLSFCSKFVFLTVFDFIKLSLKLHNANHVGFYFAAATMASSLPLFC